MSVTLDAEPRSHRVSRAGDAGSTIGVTGAGGLVGSALVQSLERDGCRVLRLVRGPARDDREVSWNPTSDRIDASPLEGLDAMIHLAGENIAARRWSAAQKRRIRDSRVGGTRLIAQTLAKLVRPPSVMVSASAIGFYGDRGDEILDETSPPGQGFLAETCRDWEAQVVAAEAAGIRVVRLRIGVVLSLAGGALARMAVPFRLGLGGRIGDGSQYMSWIAVGDLVAAIRHALSSDGLAGAINAVAPAPVTNAEFVRALARALRRPAILPFPAFAVRCLMGEMGTELLLASSRVLPRALERSGFRFRHPEVDAALAHLFAGR